MEKYRYIFRKGEDELIFSTILEAGKHFGMSSGTIAKFIRDGKYLNYNVTTEVREVEKKASKILPLVIVSPSGEKVAFSSLKGAQAALGVASQTLSYYAQRGKQCQGYSFTRTKDTKGAVEMSAEFQKALHDAFEANKKKLADDDDNDTRVPIATGYYDESYGPVICPICHEVICRNTSITVDGKSTTIPLAHLNKCLEGHEYKIKHSVIYVYN